VLVTERESASSLYEELKALQTNNTKAAGMQLLLLGDALAPGLIADAVFAGHLAAEEFEADPEAIDAALFKRELPSLNDY
jgi:dimethylamine/trimethylamine dehydrogenase